MAVIPVLPPVNATVMSTSVQSAIVAAVGYLLAPPRAELRQTVVQSLAVSGTWAAIAMDTYDVDDNQTHVRQHDNVTNNSRFTAVYPGWYHCSGGVGFAASVTNRRGARWAVNGTAVNGAEVLAAPTPTGPCEVPTRGKMLYLNPGDYVECQGFQESGGALNTAITAGQQSNASILWVSS